MYLYTPLINIVNVLIVLGASLWTLWGLNAQVSETQDKSSICPVSHNQHYEVFMKYHKINVIIDLTGLWTILYKLSSLDI